MRAQTSIGRSGLQRAMRTAATVVACASFAGETASAVTLTFDSDGTTTADVVDGSANWNTTAGNTVWWNGTTNVPWTTLSDAVFGGTSGTPGTVTITTAITPNSMTFNVDGYTVADTSTGNRLILASPGGITANGTAVVKTFRAALSQTETQTWTVAPGKSFTMDATPGANTSQFFVGGNSDLGKTLTLAGGGTVNFIASSNTFGLNVPQNSNLVVNSATVTVTGRTTATQLDDVAIVIRGRTGAGLAAKTTINTGGTIDVGTNTVTVQMNTDGTTFLPLGAPGELHLDGGTIALGSFGNATATTPLSSTGALYFNGGEVKANKTNPNFMVAPFVSGVGGSGLSAVYVGANGANINSNGFDITVATPLIPDPASPGGGFTKKGAGTLTLTAASTYTGTTTVNAGTLTVLDAAGLGAATGGLVVANPNTGAGTNVLLNLPTTAATTKGSLSGAIAAPSSGANTATIDNGGQLLTINQTTAGNYQGTIAGAGGFALGTLSTAALTLSGANTFTGGTTVNANTLVLAHADATAGGAIDVKDGALAQAQAGLPKAVTVSTLSTNATGKFDVTNNSMVVKAMTDAQVRTQLQAGYNGGAWNGATGITSSAVNSSTSVGYASNTSLGLTEFKGVSGLTGTDVIVKYTYAGDANLDGKVDIGDLGLLAGAWQQLTGKVWFDGDFTYDGAVNIGDLGLLAGNWQKGTAGNPSGPLMDFNTALAQFSAFDGVVVPEPASLALLSLGGGLALGGRRRRVRQN